MMYENLFSARQGIKDLEWEVKYRADFPIELKRRIIKHLIQGIWSDDKNDALKYLHEKYCKYTDDFNEIFIYRCALISNHWEFIFDAIELIYAYDVSYNQGRGTEDYSSRVNRQFKEEGIGWELVNGQFTAKSSLPLEQNFKNTLELLEKNSLNSALKSVEDSLAAFNRRPEPDLRAAISHAYSALESVAREITTKPNELGKQFEYLETLHLLPENSKAALKAVWGWVNDSRHLKEENISPEFEEAEFLVTVATGLTVYLMAKHYKNNSLEIQPEPKVFSIAPEAYDDDIPF